MLRKSASPAGVGGSAGAPRVERVERLATARRRHPRPAVGTAPPRVPRGSSTSRRRARPASVASAAARRASAWAATAGARARLPAPRRSPPRPRRRRASSPRHGPRRPVGCQPQDQRGPGPETASARPTRYGQRARARPARSGSSNASTTSGQARRRIATAARAWAAGSRSSASHGTSAPHRETAPRRGRRRGRGPRPAPASRRPARRGSPGPRACRGRGPAPRCSGPGPDQDRGPGTAQEPMAEDVVGERPVRVDAAGDDLGDRVGLDDVDPLEGGDDGLLGGGQGRGDRAEAHVAGRTRRAASSTRARRTASARWLPAGTAAPGPRRRAVDGRRGGASSRARGRGRGAAARARGMAGTPDPEEVGAGRHQRRRGVGRASRIGERQSVSPIQGRGASPRTPRSSRRAVRLASIRSSASPASRRASASAAARRSGSASSSASKAEVDGPAGHVERELLGRQVVLEPGRWRTAGRSPPARRRGVPADVALDDRATRGARSFAVEPGHAEQPQDGALRADGRRGAGPGAPGAGEVLGAPEDDVEAGLDRAARCIAAVWRARKVEDARAAGGRARSRPARPGGPLPLAGSSPGARRRPGGRSRRGRRRSAPPSRSAPGPSSRRSRSGPRRTRRRGAGRRRRRRPRPRPAARRRRRGRSPAVGRRSGPRSRRRSRRAPRGPSARRPRTRGPRRRGRRGAAPRPPGPAPACRASRGSGPRRRRRRRRPAVARRSASARPRPGGSGAARSSRIRLGPASRPALDAVLRPPADRRDAGDLVAVGQRLVRGRVVPVAGEAERTAARRRGPGGRPPRAAHASSIVDPAAISSASSRAPGGLALHGEQPDPDRAAASPPLRPAGRRRSTGRPRRSYPPRSRRR